MRVVTRIRDGQLPAGRTEANQSALANPSPSYSPPLKEIQFCPGDWLRARREVQEERGLGRKTMETAVFCETYFFRTAAGIAMQGKSKD
jgi:8-oxo-dGTP pyrophosphatase MutT (NUDIX family)